MPLLYCRSSQGSSAKLGLSRRCREHDCLAHCPRLPPCRAVSARLLAAATFILINVRSTVVGHLEAQRADPDPHLPSDQVPQLAQ